MSDKELIRLLIASVTRRGVVFLGEQAGLAVEGVEAEARGDLLKPFREDGIKEQIQSAMHRPEVTV